MKLSQSMKERIVAKIMADVPQHDYQAEADKTILPIAIARLPMHVQRLYKSEHRSYLHFYSVRPSGGGVYISIPTTGWIQAGHTIGVLGEEGAAEFDRLGKAAIAQKVRRKELQRELMGNIKSCTTVASFKAKFPNLAAYAPEQEAPVANLPATQVFDNLAALGWTPPSVEGASA